jgi:hypothetical protein
MAEFGFLPQLTATGTIAPNRFVTMSGVFEGAQVSAITQIAVGVTDQSTRRFDNTTDHAIAGDEISLQPTRLVQVECAAGITAGARVAPSANGRAQTAVATQFPFGIAVNTTTTAGEMVWVLYAPSTVIA